MQNGVVEKSPRFQRPGALARDLREAGSRYLRAGGRSRYASPGQWSRAAVWTTGLLASLALAAISTGPSALGPIAGAGVFGFLLLATLSHDAAHGAVSRHRWVNERIVTFGFGLFGISGRLWRWRHLKLHHNFANVKGTDIDGEGSLLVRLAPHGPWRWWHRYQAWYAPFLYALVFPHLTWVDDWTMLALARRTSPAQFRGRGEEARLVFVKACHASLCLIAPYVLLAPPIWLLLAGYATYMGVASMLFVTFAAGTHLSTEAEFVVPGDGWIGHDWAQHQLWTSVDWAPENRLAIAMTGGANAHTAHHLFPDFAHHHNAALSRIVTRISAAHGEHHKVTDFAGMVRAHFRHLAELGKDPVREDAAPTQLSAGRP